MDVNIQPNYKINEDNKEDYLLDLNFIENGSENEELENKNKNLKKIQKANLALTKNNYTLSKFKITSNKAELSHYYFHELIKELPNINSKATKFVAKNIDIQDCDVRYTEIFNNISEIKLQNCIVTSNFGHICNFNNLTHISLIGVGLIDETFKEFCTLLSQKEEIRKSIKYLNVSNNQLTKLGIDEFKENTFEELKELIMKNNYIYQYSKDPLNATKNIKFIDFTSNNFSSEYKITILLYTNYDKKYNSNTRNFLVFLNRNIGVISSEIIIDYYLKYLCIMFNSIQYNNIYVKTLDLQGLISPLNKSVFNDLKINDNLTNLKELDISYCNLSDQILINMIIENSFFQNLVHLKKFNFSYNHLTNFFIIQLISQYKTYASEKKDSLWKELKTIDFSGNEIETFKIDGLEEFTNTFSQIKYIGLKWTKFEKDIEKYLRVKYKKYYYEQKNINGKIKDIDKGEIIAKIIDGDGNNLLNRHGLKFILSKRLNHINSEKITKVFPHFEDCLEFL